MKSSTQKYWVLVALIGMSYWFFGNLYEQIVFAPNWITESPKQFKRLNDFFIHTTPTHYFVPLTQLATILIWILYWRNTEQLVQSELKKASWVAVLDTLLTIFIVSTIVIKLFGANYLEFSAQLHTLAWRWNILNLFRMLLTGIVIYFLFQTFRKLDKIAP